MQTYNKIKTQQTFFSPIAQQKPQYYNVRKYVSCSSLSSWWRQKWCKIIPQLVQESVVSDPGIWNDTQRHDSRGWNHFAPCAGRGFPLSLPRRRMPESGESFKPIQKKSRPCVSVSKGWFTSSGPNSPTFPGKWERRNSHFPTHIQLFKCTILN